MHPNNPDGGHLRRGLLLWLLEELADLDLVVIDESYIDFVDAERSPSLAGEAAIRPNAVVLKSLGRNLGLHGARPGYCVANPAIAARLREALPPGSPGAFTGTVVSVLREYAAEYRQSLSLTAGDRAHMSLALAALPDLVVFLSQGNFLLVKLPDGVDGAVLCDRLLAEHGIHIRACGDMLGSSDRFLRPAVRPYQDVERLVTGLHSCLYGTPSAASHRLVRAELPAGAAVS